MDLKGILRVVLEAWGKSALSRFFIVLISIGAGLLGIGWPEVVASALDKAFGQSKGTSELWAPITGVFLIAFGIAGRLIMHVRALKLAERQLATSLIGQIHELVRGFNSTGEVRDSGYYNNKIVETIQTAREYQKMAPKAIAASRELAGLSSPAWDASKLQPFTNLTLNELTSFAKMLEGRYGINK
jgi:hypothetical protein